MRLRPAFLVSILLAIPKAAECTQANQLAPGARIRFDARGVGDHLTGTLIELQPDTLMVSVDGDAFGLNLIVPVDSLKRLQQRGERTLAGEGLGLGVLAGTLVALVADPNALDEDGNCTTLECISYQVSSDVGTRIAVLALTGAVLGAIAGSRTKVDTWLTVPLERLQVGPTSDGGLAFGVRISF